MWWSTQVVTQLRCYLSVYLSLSSSLDSRCSLALHPHNFKALTPALLIAIIFSPTGDWGIHGTCCTVGLFACR